MRSIRVVRQDAAFTPRNSHVRREFTAHLLHCESLSSQTLQLHEMAKALLRLAHMPKVCRVTFGARGGLIVVSNREPYLHLQRPDGTIGAIPTTGGVSVALDALMRERGGTWIAHGAGEADAAVVDANDRVAVPPDSPAYTLRRVWLTPEEERRYYNGFANEGLWPLAHTVHVPPVFRTEDWSAYRSVNTRFAHAVAAELIDPATPVFIQDYHLALVAGELRRLEPAVRTAFFWHIPWPHPDRLRMCPWRADILKGLLANDLLAFQLERDRRNFLLSVRDELRAVVEPGRVVRDGRETRVTAAPIGVDFDRIQRMASDSRLTLVGQRLQQELQIDPSVQIVGVGVDRLDYTKGIPERLDAIDRLLAIMPELRSRLVFVQIGVPSRTKIHTYAEVEKRIDRRIAEINAKYGDGPDRGPIRYRKSALNMRGLVALYRLADFCIVSSLHDGMNLVAKEFVAARTDGDGVLILSEMTGAAQELHEALLINPYHADGFAQTIARAISMPAAERAWRMRALRQVVAGRDVFQWASEILDGLDTVAPPSTVTPWPPARVDDGLLRRLAEGAGSNVRG
jgi:trehalose-6-phosphate synthase